jgi:hypothetical protein
MLQHRRKITNIASIVHGNRPANSDKGEDVASGTVIACGMSLY